MLLHIRLISFQFTYMIKQQPLNWGYTIIKCIKRVNNFSIIYQSDLVRFILLNIHLYLTSFLIDE